MQITVRVEVEALGTRSEAVVEEHSTCTEANAVKVAEVAATAARRAWAKSQGLNGGA